MSHVNSTNLGSPYARGTTTLNYDHGGNIDRFSYTDQIKQHHTYNTISPTAGSQNYGARQRRDSTSSASKEFKPEANPTFESLEDDHDEDPVCWKMLHDPILAKAKNCSQDIMENHPLISSNPDSNHFRLDGKIISIDTPTKYNKIQTLDPEEVQNCTRKDPRHGAWLTKSSLKKAFRLPKFDVDNNYVGKLPNKVLVLSRLCTTMTKDMLEEEIFRLYGEPNIEKISLYAPSSRSAPEPTGLAKIVFRNSHKCRQAQQYLDQKQIWKSIGSIHACFDPKGTWLKTLFDYITQGKIEPENAPTKDEFERKHFKPNHKPPRKKQPRIQSENIKQTSNKDPTKLPIETLEKSSKHVNVVDLKINSTSNGDLKVNEPTTPDSAHTPEERTPSPHTPDEVDEALRPHTPVTPGSDHSKSKRSSSAHSYVRTPSPEPDSKNQKRKKKKDRQNAAALFLQDLQGKAPRTPLIQNLPTIPSTHQKNVNKPPPRIKSDVKRAKTGEFMMNQVGQHLFQMLLVRDIRRKFVLTLQNHAMNDLVSKVKIQKQRVEIERRKKTSNTIISVDTGAQLKRKLETAVNQPVPVKRTRIDPVSGEPSLRVDDVFSDSEDDEETSRGSRASKDRSPRASQGDSDDDMGSSIPELPDTIMYTPASPIHDPLFDRSVNFLQNTVLEAHNYSSKFKAQHQVPAKTADAIFFDKLDAYEIEDNEEPDFYRHTELDFYLSLNGKTSSSIWHEAKSHHDDETYDYFKSDGPTIMKNMENGRALALLDDEDLKFFNTQLKLALPGLPFPSTIKPPEVLTMPSFDEIMGFNEIDEFYHASGSARTEGYYQETFTQRRKWKQKLYDEKIASGLPATIGIDHDYIESFNMKAVYNKAQDNSRNIDMRKIRTAFNETELSAYNQMNFRKKNVKFMRSLIHGWGLFAMEEIPRDTLVIEYLGEQIRMSLCDHREEKNEEMGEMSSYMFRINREQVVDATRHGNYARFINHSCQPNCYAKVITSDNQEKIVIYSNRSIQAFEEITYDYKFPLEDVKIPCYCGTSVCRKYLN